MGAQEIAEEMLGDVRAVLGDAWGSLPEAERWLAKDTVEDLATVHLAAFMGEDVAEDLEDLDVQLGIMSAEVRKAVAAAFRKRVLAIAGTLASGLLSAAGKELIALVFPPAVMT